MTISDVLANQTRTVKFYAYLISVTPQSSSDDGVHVERPHLVRVLGDELAKLVPHRVVRLAALRNEVRVVDQLGQQDRSLVQSADGDKVLDVLLGVVGEELEVAAKNAYRRFLDALVALKFKRSV